MSVARAGCGPDSLHLAAGAWILKTSVFSIVPLERAGAGGEPGSAASERETQGRADLLHPLLAQACDSFAETVP